MGSAKVAITMEEDLLTQIDRWGKIRPILVRSTVKMDIPWLLAKVNNRSVETDGTP